MIAEVLNKAEAIKIFEEEAILIGRMDVVPFYRAVELFGEEAAEFLVRCVGLKGYMESGIDWNGMGECGDERPFTQYLFQSGFLKLVTEHNYLHVVKSHRKSEGGHILDRYSEERSCKIAEQEAEEERKRAERKAKRAAAREDTKKKEEGE